jgi:OmpA-OmpF porin, OOP family
MAMRNASILATSVGVALAISTGVHAQPAYRAEQIINHFSAPPNLGATRALCIGTERECPKLGASNPVAAAPSFDLVVTFDLNSFQLTEQARRNLDEFARALEDPRLSTAAFAIDGHTDGHGSDRFNLELSDRRAKAVVNYMREKGVDPKRLVAKGHGKQKPRVQDLFDPANRRVETRVLID